MKPASSPLTARRRPRPALRARHLLLLVGAFSLIVSAAVSGCGSDSSEETPAPITPSGGDAEAGAPRYVGYVNPFIGTQNHGNTYPGATLPFGMVQFSPDTGHYAGYDYDGTAIRGFSLVHLSGVGCAIGGMLPVLPTTGGVTATRSETYQEAFAHDTEVAEPGYYAVTLSSSNGPIRAELSATHHTAVQKYTFPTTQQANVLINAGEALSTISASTITIVDDRTVEAQMTVSGFCQETRPFTIHTVTRFNRPFAVSGTWIGDAVTPGAKTATSTIVPTGAFVQFDTTNDQVVEAVTALSYVDGAGARKNLDAESASFADAKKAASDVWEERLSKVAVASGDSARLRTFYSALYRSFLAPNTGTDVDGRYMGWDAKPHEAAKGTTYYQNFSLWDTYRTQQQMLALLAPKQSADMALSLILHAEQGGWAPRWAYGPVETNIMTGDPITPFLVSAWSQGLLAGHEERAYAVLKQNADSVPPALSPANGRAGNATYIEKGFVPYSPDAVGKPGDFDFHHGASATLEYALSDAALATMAAKLGHADDAARYAARAQSFRAILDAQTLTFRARGLDGFFVPEADPTKAPGFHEGTAVQYQWLAQQDMPGLVATLGGATEAAKRLDDFFAYDKLLQNPEETARKVWVSGVYDYYDQSKYNPNNEPDLHAPYAYLWAAEPWKTADVVRAALSLFTDGPSGVTGNDDLGEMSAWAVMSSLGLYPSVPGSNVWSLSTPYFPEVHVTLDPAYYPNGTLDILAPGVSAQTRYVQDVKVGDAAFDRGFVTGAELKAAKVIRFTVGGAPSKWATGPDAAPKAMTTGTAARRVTAASVPATVSAPPGGTVNLALKILAVGPATTSGTVSVTGSDKVTVTSGGTWQVATKGAAAQLSAPITLAIAADAPSGILALTLVVRDDAGTETTAPLGLTIP